MQNYDALQFECQKFADDDEFKSYLSENYPDFLATGYYVQVAVGKGWWPFVLHLAQFMRDNGMSGQCRISQIKEKFGTLRIYAEPIADKDIYNLLYGEICRLEGLSASHCEKCGTREHVSTDTKPGGYWVKTYCDACFQDSSNG